MQNLKRTGLFFIITIFLISIAIYFFIPFLAYTASKDIENKEFAKAGKLNMLLGNISTDPLKKGNYYLTAGNCCLEIKDIECAINAYEKAEKNIEFMGEFEKERLTDLYIINKDYEKASARSAKYKIDILNQDWEKALKELTEEIDKPASGQLIDGKIFADYDKYLARAIVYKNMGKDSLAEKDFNTALSLEPSKKVEIETIYKNKDYFKEYYERIEKVFQ